MAVRPDDCEGEGATIINRIIQTSMKYLSDYMQDAQTIALDTAGAFFCFSKSQFDEKKVEGVTYVNLNMGLVCPKENAAKLLQELNDIYHAGIKQDIAENGLKRIIIRELNNHEAYYTGDIEDTAQALSDYPITRDDIRAVYRNKNHELEQIVPEEEVPDYPKYTPV